MATTRGEHPARRPAVLAGFAALAVVLAGIAGRILSYPLNRDENLFIAAASALGRGDLYRDLGYNHLPNFAYLLGALYRLTDTQYLLLTGRILMFAGWIAALCAIWLLVRKAQQGIALFFAASALLVGNVLLLGPSGMLVSNNFIPIPFILFAFLFLWRALEQGRPRRTDAFLAGVMVSLTIGLKANYIILAPFFALATLIAPRGVSIGQRLIRGGSPLAMGGVIGGLPVLAHLALDPEGFIAHTLRYFTELQPAYWRSVDGPKTVSIAEKILLAEDVWMSGVILMAAATCAVLCGIVALRSGARALFDWRLLILSGLLGCSVLVAFVPTPSFPQYFVPPVPFLILLMIVLAGMVEEESRAFMHVLLIVFAMLGLVTGASRVLPGLLAFRHPETWQSLAIHREIRMLGSAAGLARGARIAALTPVPVVEGGYAIYPEFAAGQFVYRVAPYIAPADRRFYRTTSPGELFAFLDANPPAAILVDTGEPVEARFADYARARGFTRLRSRNGYSGFELYVPPSGNRARPPSARR